tara:strand:- start:274 stop:540 length:267 start_codon:yes stop_codon:yes gene_type:complete
MRTKIYHKLNNFFNPSILEVINESEQHSGHLQSPKTGSSHFFVKISSTQLDNLSRLEGQRLIFKILKQEMSKEIHALRIKIIYNNYPP